MTVPPSAHSGAPRASESALARRTPIRPSPGAAVGVAAVVLYLVVVPWVFAERSYLLSVIITASMVAFVSLGVWLTFAIGRINIAQGGFAMVGGYAAALLVGEVGLSFWLALPLSGLIAALAGAVIGWPLLRLKGVYFAMISLSLTEAIRLFFLNATWLSNGAGGLVDLPLPQALAVGGLTLIPAFEPGARLPFYYLAAFLLLGGLLLLWRIHRSRLGMIFQAMQQSEDLAAGIGVPLTRYRVLAFAICCGYGGIGGAFFTTFQQNIFPSSYQVTDSVYFMMYCFVGGLGSVFGPVVGAGALLIAFEALGEFQRLQSALYATVMIAIMLFLPNGLASLPAVLRRRRTG